MFLGSDGFFARYRGVSMPLERLREIPRAPRCPQAKPLAAFATGYPVRWEAMARAFLTGVYTLHEIADYFGVHDFTVSRAVHWLEAGGDSPSAPLVL